MEPSVSKYRTVGMGGCKQSLNREPLERRVAISFQIGNYWNHQFLNMEMLEQEVANSY